MIKQTTSTDENYWGLFAVSDRWWCDNEKAGGLCNVNCNDLLTDLEKNVQCGRQVYRQDGSGAWKLSADCVSVDNEQLDDCQDSFGTSFGEIKERIGK